MADTPSASGGGARGTTRLRHTTEEPLFHDAFLVATRAVTTALVAVLRR